MCPVDKCAPGGPDASGETVRLRFKPSAIKDKGLEFGSSDTVARWLFLLPFSDRFASFDCVNSRAAPSNDAVKGCFASKLEPSGRKSPALAFRGLCGVGVEVCFFRWHRIRNAVTMMMRMRTPAPTPMPTLVARLGPLSGESVEVGTGGATGSPTGIDDDEDEDAGATKDVVNVELEGIKDVVVIACDCVSVIELTEVVDCCERVLGATVVDASEAEDIDDG
jgi:hypothetical protein